MSPTADDPTVGRRLISTLHDTYRNELSVNGQLSFHTMVDALVRELRAMSARSTRSGGRSSGRPSSSLALIETGNQHAVQHEFAHHGDRLFLEHLDELVGGDG
jgi:hypothetical protein